MNKPILIVGGGPAGLAAAHALARVGQNSVVVEKEDRLGGAPILSGYAKLVPSGEWARDAIGGMVDRVRNDPLVDVQKSLDGVTWTAGATGTTANLHGVSGVSLGGYVATGAGGTILLGSIAAVWTPVTSAGTTSDLHAATYGNGRWVAVGDAGTIVTSTDGLTWTATPSGTANDLRGLAFAQVTSLVDGALTTTYQFVAVGKAGTVLTSADGLAWTPQAAGAPPHLASVTRSGTQFCAMGDYGTILTSPDGALWAPQASGAVCFLRGVVWSGTLFAGVGDFGVAPPAVHPQPQLRVPAHVHLEHIRAALREVTDGFGRIIGGRVDRVLVDQPVSADAGWQRKHGDDRRAGAEREHAEREGGGRRPIEEIDGDRVGRLDVLVDQDRHAVVGGQRLEHPPERAPPVDHVVAQAAAHPFEQVVEPAIIERSRQDADRRERGGMGDGVDRRGALAVAQVVAQRRGGEQADERQHGQRGEHFQQAETPGCHRQLHDVSCRAAWSGR